jgi:hypothetical protein
VLCLVRRARSTTPIGGAPHGWKTPWAPRIAVLFAGERERRALWPGGLREQVEWPQTSRKQVCDRLQSLRWARERRASARRYRPLQPVAPRARDRRCPGQADRDNARLAWSLVDPRDGRHLCGASRSGPGPMKLDWRDSARSSTPPGSHSTMVRQGESPEGQRHCEVTYRRCAKGFRRSGAVLMDRRVAIRRPGPAKNVALDGAAGGGGPWGSCPRRAGRQIPTLCGEELERGRQRQDDDLPYRPTTPRGKSAARRAP